MSRQSVSTKRNLTLTEELEKLEQSITLTLQEIDHNFSKAHRIVTTSILPIVEQYAEHSKSVWDGSKFWKQFFEASANVALSGYEEAALEDDVTHDTTETTHQDDAYGTPSTRADDTVTAAGAEQYEGEQNTSLLDSPSHAGTYRGTPHMPSTAKRPNQPKASTATATFADYPSPYETFRRELDGNAPNSTAQPSTTMPTTPGKRAQQLPDTSMTPTSSPFAPPSAYMPSTQRRTNPDPLLHRVLDKNYRVQATPHTQRRHHRSATQPAARGTPQTATATATARNWTDSSPLSSPEVAAPQLRSDIFSSPLKAPRTPGVSVQQKQTPRRATAAAGPAGTTTSIGRGLFSGAPTTAGNTLWDSDDGDDEDGDGGDGIQFSPPKTMHFHIPQSRLLQTPAREASRRIVEDLLMTAGGDITDDVEGENSPSVVRRAGGADEDTF
ncbi:DASH complex subunit Ask1-domain-containing protein [Cryomyces antarcticus]